MWVLFVLRDSRRARRYLTTSTYILVANALVSSRLDYCNYFYRSLSKVNLHKLQCLQNSAARTVTNTRKFSSISPVLKSLHWLPVHQHLFLHTGFPKYFGPNLQSYKDYSCYNTRHTSNEGANILVVPKFSHSSHKSVKLFGYSFAFDAPTVWNSLPVDGRSSPSLGKFRRKLKSYLFPRHIHHSSSSLFHGADPYLVPGLFFCDHRLWLLRLRVCYSAIEHYKSPIRIRTRHHIWFWRHINCICTVHTVLFIALRKIVVYINMLTQWDDSMLFTCVLSQAHTNHHRPV